MNGRQNFGPCNIFLLNTKGVGPEFTYCTEPRVAPGDINYCTPTGVHA